uniref:DUF975 family protein n=1 Tax=Agathobacter sp. TaxID=2021311 RepID=UPI0040559EC5
MWSRVQLKDRAKEALKRNYWKSVLVGLLCIFIGTSSGLELNLKSNDNTSEDVKFNFSYDLDDELYDYNDSYAYGDIYDYDYDHDYDDIYDDYGIYGNFYDHNNGSMGNVFGFAKTIVIVFIIIAVIASVIAILLSTFILNPLEVGASRFFLKNLDKNTQIGELGFAFDTEYKNVAKIMFFRGLYTILWTLLFIIPGIVKSYEYCMIPYLLAENPSLTKEQAFAVSKQMMDGQKWRTFVLDLSFIGWEILSTITLGLVSVFYLNPYMHQTYAALYQELSQQNGGPAFGVPNQQIYYEQAFAGENPYPQANPYETPTQEECAYGQPEQRNNDIY